MSLITPWLLCPCVLAAVGAGWGALVERAAGRQLPGALIVPLGLAAALVVCSIVTISSATAPASVPIVAAGALAGLILAWPARRINRWPLLAAIAVLLIYGAPVLLSGQATFAGYIRLDDTATWLAYVDRIMDHGRSLAGLPPSTYQLLLKTDIGGAYPLGAYFLLGVGHGLTRIDAAWIFQPYLALCGAMVALGAYALVEPIVASPRVRAVSAFLGAQPALLYGYSLWGGIKELTAAFVLVLGVALANDVIASHPRRARELLPLSVAAAALIVTLGPGAGAWIGPGLLAIMVAWLLPWSRAGWHSAVRLLAGLGAFTAVLVLPVWAVLASFLQNRGDLAGQLFSSGESAAVRLGNLTGPLKPTQLAGIWPVGDFRNVPATVPAALLLTCSLLAAAGAVYVTVRRRKFGVPLYVAVALAACGVSYLAGATPWIIGKTLAFDSPAVLTASVAGAALLWQRHRIGVALIALIAAGVLWSNALAYHDVLLAPRDRLAELQYIGKLVAGHGPTFINEYEIYADRHFLRDGAPVEPAEYRPVVTPVLTGVSLTKSAYADLDSFSIETLAPYRSLVIRRSPVESRPPSSYRLRWQGRYYELWQRTGPSHIVQHVPLGDSLRFTYCGNAQDGPTLNPCPIEPVAKPPCSEVQQLARVAAFLHARLVAYQRPDPIAVRADETLWPGRWYHDRSARTLTAEAPGKATAHIGVDVSEPYELWLGGSFARGLEVSVDGRRVGHVSDQLANLGDWYVHLTDLFLTAGVHTMTLTYPQANLAPGSGDDTMTTLSAIVLEPKVIPQTKLLSVDPAHARTLCGRPLDWIEIVR